mmetsp:Transcript_4032/g.7138  ORF Transcript_4032/g.7138 Transcript_4032/m.7138 type:complete len:282 (-) Transcript_4032:166-1011(-)
MSIPAAASEPAWRTSALGCMLAALAADAASGSRWLCSCRSTNLRVSSLASQARRSCAAVCLSLCMAACRDEPSAWPWSCGACKSHFCELGSTNCQILASSEATVSASARASATSFCKELMTASLEVCSRCRASSLIASDSVRSPWRSTSLKSLFSEAGELFVIRWGCTLRQLSSPSLVASSSFSARNSFSRVKQRSICWRSSLFSRSKPSRKAAASVPLTRLVLQGLPAVSAVLLSASKVHKSLLLRRPARAAALLPCPRQSSGSQGSATSLTSFSARYST